MVRVWFYLLSFTVVLLSLTTTIPLLFDPLYFSIWFRLGFALGVLVFCVCMAANLSLIEHPRWIRRFETGDLKNIVWFLVWLSFFAAASLHQFHLFNPSREFFLSLNSQLNLLGILGVPLLYYFRKRVSLPVTFLTLASVLLIPNDSCRNPFNMMWLHWGLNSPMMFVPNVAAILFALPLLNHRVNWISLGVLAVTVICTFILGFGHITAFIW